MTAIPAFEPPTAPAVGAEHFLTDGARVVLRVSRCRACNSSWFPSRAQCSNCASKDVSAEVTSSTGTAYASTVVRVGPRQFPAPYTVAYVDVEGVRLLAHVISDDALPPGTPVDLVLAPIGADDRGPLLSYAVAPSSGGAR